MTKQTRILLVEDNPGDVRLTREAFKETDIVPLLDVVYDGEEALEFLYRSGNYTGANRPDLILLDLNLPRKDGREVLAEIKQDVDLRRIPVVVLTTSQSEQDIRTTYDLHANCYIAKPLDIDTFSDIVHAIQNFWLTTATLPAF